MLADNEDFKELFFDYYPILNNDEKDFKKAIDCMQAKIIYETFKKNNFTTYEVLEYFANEQGKVSKEILGVWKDGLLGKINEGN